MQTVMASRNAVENFLEKIGLERYGTRFLTQGYDRIIDLCILDEEDLDSLSIRERDDRFKILDAGKYISPYFLFTLRGVRAPWDRIRATRPI